MLAEIGRAGKNGILIDTDQGLEPDFALHYGADPDHFFLCQGLEPGRSLEFTETILQKKLYSMVVIDSVTDFMDETVNGFEHNQQVFSIYLPRLARLAKESGAVLVFTEHTNPWERQVYHQLAHRLEKISLSLHAGVRLELHPVTDKTGEGAPGQWVEISILKGKKTGFNTPVRLNLLYNHLHTKCAEILDLGTQSGIIQIQEGAFVYGEHLLGSDYHNSYLFLTKNLAVTEKIEQDIRNRLALQSGLE
jgi:RecA/RadA recombinase